MQLNQFIEKGHMTQAELARRLDVTPGLIWQWLNDHRRIAAEQVIPIEKATDGAVTRHDLRPDLYPRDNAA
jgi:DNA-binding transcriptional regulator YdaS (Cro superfamily)